MCAARAWSTATAASVRRAADAAAGAEHVTIIEAASSCADARHNLAHNAFQNADVREQRFGVEALRMRHVVVDPPRRRRRPARPPSRRAQPRVVLVSCSLASLARDLGRLAPTHRLVRMRLCDLFPHTEHVEAVSLLERR